MHAASLTAKKSWCGFSSPTLYMPSSRKFFLRIFGMFKQWDPNPEPRYSKQQLSPRLCQTLGTDLWNLAVALFEQGEEGSRARS